MDWTNKSAQQNQTSSQNVGPTSSHGMPANKKGKRFNKPSWFKALYSVLLISGAILVVSIIIGTVFGPKNTESELVKKDRYQAIFLTGGQVYFGRIDSMNGKYMRLTSIFYLRTSPQVQPNGTDNTAAAAPELVPLGCELHRPQNEMQINRDQIIFWENLQDESNENTVPGAIKKYVAANPTGQKCSTPAAAAPAPAPVTTAPATTKPR